MKSKCFFFLLLLVPFFDSVAQQDSLLAQQFGQSKVLGRHHYGFALFDLDSTAYTYTYQADQHFTPASNTKTYTLFTSLKHIGDSIPGIRYIERGDSLIFWGTGDPTFLHAKLDNRRVYDFLRLSGKKLFYAAQENAEGAYRDGWSIEDYQYYYQPDIAVFPIYGNVVRFSSDKGKLQAQPTYFEQHVSTRSKPEKYFSVGRKLANNDFETTNTQVPNNYKAEKPFIWSDSLLVRLLSDTLKVEVSYLDQYDMPVDTKTLYSVPRNMVLREMMLPSDNFLAEHLYMVAAYERFGAFKTDSLRKEMFQQYFSLSGDTIMLRDGSGLSSYNKITPNSMINLLRMLRKDIADEFQLKMFFPAGGVDGTIKSAYHIGKEGPFVWAKTGTLHAVHCQSGYITTKSGRQFAFSFLNNNFVVPTSAVRREMVRIVTYIHENY